MRKNLQPVNPGDAIALVAPAANFDPDAFTRGVDVLCSLGYKPLYDDLVFTKNGYLAGNDVLRARLLQEAFASPDAKAVMLVRGGYGCMRLLPLLDLNAVARSGKPLIGFSDCTALFGALYWLAGRPCWHGPMVTQMPDLCANSLQAFTAALAAPGAVSYKAGQGVCLSAGEAYGTFFGGNLSVLCALLGTPYWPDLSGHILFLEDVGEPLYKIDRMFTQLKLAGILDRVAGVVLGEFKDCGDETMVYARLQELLGRRDIPVLANFPAGHGNNNVPLPIGRACVLNSTALTLDFSRAS